ncbi:hypothetical protein ACE1CI_16855 [Aerosakkonemataceae cyanobacterium BLCC-F50]|uniref:Uncharacterized protein n=1 Tax=Floridaenema flaviceps BLCC-F50 TaxID=3153642 RepID=A0ABV4XT05_9CYAN
MSENLVNLRKVFDNKKPTVYLFALSADCVFPVDDSARVQLLVVWLFKKALIAIIIIFNL